MSSTDSRPALIDVNKLYNENCVVTMGRMVNGLVDYIITSPPYNLGYKQMHGKNIEKYDDFNDIKTPEDYYDWLKPKIQEMLRVVKQHVFLNIQMLSGNKSAVLSIMGDFKDHIKDIVIWNKNIAPPHIKDGVMNNKFEFIIILSNQQPQYRTFYDGNFHGNFNNVIENIKHNKNVYSRKHRAVFPATLPRKIMQKFGNDGDLWYDPFMGTGTTAVAAIREHKLWIGSEISKDYCKLAERRIQSAVSQKDLFTTSKKIIKNSMD